MDPFEMLEGMRDEQWTTGKVTFQFLKMPVFDAFRVADKIRQELALRLEGVLARGSDNADAEFITAVAQANPEFVQELCNEMFKHVVYRTSSNDGQILQGRENTAFAGMRLTEIYQVLGRSLAVNFFDTLSELLYTPEEEASA